MGWDHLAVRGGDGLTHLDLIDMFAAVTPSRWSRWIIGVRAVSRIDSGVDASFGKGQIDPGIDYGIFI
jgi:hypothetical protein